MNHKHIALFRRAAAEAGMLSMIDLAKLSGWSMASLQTWRDTGFLPPPDVATAGCAFWKRETVALFLSRHSKTAK